MEDFIQLHRDFFRIPNHLTSSAKDDSIDMQAASGSSYGTSKWQDILLEYRAVILAEAGAGKTQEIIHITQNLRDENKSAFFLRLENIVTDFESAFEIGNFKEFNEWLDTNNEGWIFLDSVDESRLKDPKDFERAIKKISDKIDIAYSRTHIFITSRVSAWRPKSDLAYCNAKFPFAADEKISFSNQVEDKESILPDRLNVEKSESKNGSNENTFKVWSIVNLSKEQIALFVKNKVIHNPSRLMDEIEKQDAWAYTTRPQDLEEIIEYWNAHDKIGSRYELMEHSIQRRLRERDQNREDTKSISPEKATTGVQLLAAASTLMHQSSIIVPDGSGYLKGIDCKQILREWNPEDCNTLLNRPIFDEAIYGTVRFHHRSTREFLTAKWLAEKLKEHGSRQRIENLFFQLQYGEWVIVPSMKPVLSWLALMDQKIMAKVYGLEPEVILQGGDPARLPLEIRKKILRSVCDKMARGIASGSVDEQASIQRFANQDLANEIKDLLTVYRDQNSVIYYLLQLICQSRIMSLAPQVQTIAINKTIGSWVRNSAIRALKIIGDSTSFNTTINSFLVESNKLDRETISEVIDNLGDSDSEIDWIVIAIEKAEKWKPYRFDGLGYALSRFIDRSNENSLTKLISEIDLLLRRKPFIERKYCQVSLQHGWLTPIALEIVEKLLVCKHPATLSSACLFALAVAPACADFAEFNSPQLKHDLSKLVPGWKEANHLLFWETVNVVRNNLREEDGERVLTDWQVLWHPHYFSFDENDFDTIIADINTRSFLDDQLLALSLAFRIYASNGRPRKWLAALKRSVQRKQELEKSLHTHLHPPAAPADIKRLRKQQQQWKLRDSKREENKKKQHEDEIKWLHDSIDELTGVSIPVGSISNPQYVLFRKMQQLNPIASTKWTSGNWKELIPDYGIELAEALRSGLLNFWRHYRPQLRSESFEGDSVPVSIVFGLAALNIESSETPYWLETLNDDTALLACRYACHDLNDFPAWFPHLYQSFPKIVHQVILKEINWELDHPDLEKKRFYILHKVHSYGKWLWNGIANELLPRLSMNAPDIESLAHLLTIIRNSEVIEDVEMAKLAESKCESNTPINQLPYWYATWIEIDPLRSIPALTATLNAMSQSDSEEAKRTAMQTIILLVEDRKTIPRFAEKFQTAEHLLQLCLLAHKYIHIKDDIRHQGVYSPGLRDKAQDARSFLFGMLKEIKGKATYLALLELSKIYATPADKIWVLNLARERATRDSDTSPWTVDQFTEFNRCMECKPNDQQQLFSLVHQRLLDLKYDLEEGDNSIASILIKEDAETKIRLFIGGWCRDRAWGRYTVAQEDELADAKRPDIRFSTASVDGAVAVELKLAENWSGAELFERLENQLCGDYLRDVRSGYGIFGLVYRGVNKKKWQTPVSKQEMSFPELIDRLQGFWDSISDKFPGINRIAVVGIDLTKRSRK